jgi:hypothetical protein
MSPRKPLGSSEALSPEFPPTYNSLDSHTHVQRRDSADKDKDTDHLILKNGRRQRTSQEEEDEDGDELDALRLDLDGMSERQEGGRDRGTGALINVDQRKALWWKNTLITGLFVASW